MKKSVSIFAVCLYLAATALFVYSIFADNTALFMCFGAAALCFGATLTALGAKK